MQFMANSRDEEILRVIDGITRRVDVLEQKCDLLKRAIELGEERQRATEELLRNHIQATIDLIALRKKAQEGGP